MTLTFFIQGLPRSKGSKRGIPIYRGKKGQPREFTGKVVTLDQNTNALKDWEAHVRYQAMQIWAGQPALRQPLKVSLSFHMRKAKKPRPHLMVWPACDPDVEKLARAVLDGLQTVIFVDDNLICRQPLEKVYGDPPGCQVTVETL
jgi:Holliday junction resolvase RusA-like endonuclease